MIFKLKSEKNKFIGKNYEKSMKEFSKFYELNWIRNKPVIILLDTRKEIDKLWGRKTEDWIVGWNDKNKIFLLNPKKYEKESNHKYSREEFGALIKHELSHAFFSVLSKGKAKPIWLNEGLAIYLSEQLRFRGKPQKRFVNFLKFHYKSGRDCYKETGFVVKLLIEKYGKQKIIRLIKSLDKINSEKEFKQLFKKIYSFELNYKNLNKLK